MALVRAVPLKDFLENPLSTSDVGDAFSTEFPQSNQNLYAALHVTAASTGRTFVGSVQAASSSGFSPLSTEVSFALSSESGSTWHVESPSTDRQWRRFQWTISTGAGSTGGTWNGLCWIGFR